MNGWGVAGIGVLLMVGIPVGCMTISNVTTVATAPGRVLNKTLETQNIIDNYERFHDTNAAYIARVSQISEQKGYLATETDSAEKIRLRTELSAMRQSCRDMATSYNADSAKINRNEFKGSSLPVTLSEEDCNA